MSRTRRRMLTDAIKEEQERAQVSAEIEWTMQALNFLKTYEGDNPVLRSLASRAKRIPNWVPTERQVIQVHRIAHRQRIETRQPSHDSLGRRLARRDEPDLPDSLAEPDWL